jgi:hypothetical protein
MAGRIRALAAAQSCTSHVPIARQRPLARPLAQLADDAIVAQIYSPQAAQPERDLFMSYASSFVNTLTAAPLGGLLDALDHPYCAIATMFFGCFVSFFVCVMMSVLCSSFSMMFLRHITTQMRRTASETYCCVLALSLSIIGECKRGSVRAVTP